MCLITFFDCIHHNLNNITLIFEEKEGQELDITLVLTLEA